MKNYLILIAIFSILLFLIPAIAYIGADNMPPAENNGTGVTSSGISGTTDVSGESDTQVPAAEMYKLLMEETGEVVELTAEQYLIGCVFAEIPAGYNEEALKAQAVAAHTYAYKLMQNEINSPSPDLKGAYFSDNASKYQAYFTLEQAKDFYGDDFDKYYTKIKFAVSDVLSKIITYNKVPISAAYHSISNGKTLDAAEVWGNTLDYLKPVKSDGDLLSPDYNGSKQISTAEVRGIMMGAYPEIELGTDYENWFYDPVLSDSDSVISINIGNISVQGTEARTLFGLRSSTFEVEYDNNMFTFYTKGYGHGVGMSQYGANVMAEKGAAYDEIIRHYFTGVEITDIDKL